MSAIPRVHVVARAPHLADHIVAVWKHLPEMLRGECLIDPHVNNARVKHWPHTDFVMVASYLDIFATGERRTVYVEHGAGQCLEPDVRVLTADLRWVPLWQVAVGDQLVAFDEYPRDQRYREWRVAEVLDATPIRKQCWELTFADGSVIVASEDHLWLRREKGTYDWMSTATLQDRDTYPRHSSKVIKAFDTWEEDRSWGGGYLAAAFDGEGCLTQTQKTPRREGYGEQQRNMLTFSQRDNEMLKEVRLLLDERGFDYSSSRYGGTYGDVFSTHIKGGYREIARFLGSIRPRRLMAGAKPMNSGQFRGTPVELISKRHVGERTVIALATSARTFIAEGFASHNCYVGNDRMDGANYYHGGSHPDHVIAYIGPRQSVIDSWGRPGFAAGAPICDPYQLFAPDKVAAITFHYNPPAGRHVPEIGTAFEHYRPRMAAVIEALRDHGYEVLGHRHPRFNHLRGYWEREHKIREADVDEVRTRAQLLIADNTSLLYEMMYLGRDVVALNAPWYRRDVEHGQRFWSHAPSVQADDADELIDRIANLDQFHDRSSRDWATTAWVYGKSHSDGYDGLRAATWLTMFLGSL